MTDVIWPDNPILEMTSLRNRPPDYSMKWGATWTHTMPVDFQRGNIKFNIKCVHDSNHGGPDRFWVKVELIDASNNLLGLIYEDDKIYVNRNQPRIIPVSVPTLGAWARFRITGNTLRSTSLGTGTVTWSNSDNRIFTLNRMDGKICFIATAAYGSELEPPVQFLREFRDEVVLKSRFRKAFEKILDAYYVISPSIAEAMIRSRSLKYLLKYSVVWPFVAVTKAAAFIVELFIKKKPNHRKK